MKRAVTALLLLICLTGLAGCQAETQNRYSGYFMDTFDTVITLIGYTDSREHFDQVLGQVEARFTELHEIFDKYHAYEGVNNLYTLNRQASQGPVTVGPDMMALLKQTLSWQSKFPGTVNIALGTVLGLWHDAREAALSDPANACLPTQAELEAAAAHTDSDSILLDEEAMTIFFTDPLVQLDLGAVAKGYAAERVVQEILLPQMPSFILNAGGNVRAGDPPADGRKAWGIGIQDPAAPIYSASESKEVLYFADTSLVTSGTYQRFFEKDGVRYHHLISPVTLQPANACESVTIVTEDSFLADFLSTACFLLPYEESRALADSLPGVEALWIFADGSTAMTEGLIPMAKSRGAANAP